MKTKNEILERIKDLKKMIEKDPRNRRLYKIWLDAMYWVLDEVENV